MNLAGWGQQLSLDGEKYILKPELKIMSLVVNSREFCEDYFTEEGLEDNGIELTRRKLTQIKDQLDQGFTSQIVCIGNDFDISEGSCKGDSGSPVIRRVTDTNRVNIFYEQHFIVSDSIACDAKASLFTRISDRQILSWIQEVTDTSPLLMVIGGDTAESLTNSIELLTPNAKAFKTCNRRSKRTGMPIRINRIIGRYFDKYNKGVNQNSTYNEFDARAMTGQFVKDAPIVCGGQNADGPINNCFQYDIFKDEWNEIDGLSEPRNFASSSLTPNGDLWVLGGTHDINTNPLKTEVYDSDRKSWRLGFDLPGALRDTGIDSHCTMR